MCDISPLATMYMFHFALFTRECPAEECGAGIFMAAHNDRQYCGKCGLTYVFNKPEA